MEPGRRRLAVPVPPTDDPGRPELVALLRDEIAATGRITFARFMQRALYEPDLGYYTSSGQRTTRAGDFLTAPELHPIFGHALARQVDEMWQRLERPSDFTLREYGAGRGTLGTTIGEGLERIGSPLAGRLRYEPLEVGHPAPGRMTGCVLANEFLDALPVHRVVVDSGRLRELYVGWSDGRFVEVVGELSSPDLADWFSDAGVQLAEGQQAEACPRIRDWLADVGATLERGHVLVIDYAAEPAALYGWRRFGGTLRAFRAHHVSSDVLRGVGERDLTATVDLGALERVARANGFTWLGRTTQAEFLAGCGLEEALADERARVAEDWPAMLELRAAVGRLLDPRALGGYAAVVLGRNVRADPALRGLAFRLRRG